MIKLLDILLETIKAADAHNDVDSVQSIIDEKRNIAFITRVGNNPTIWENIRQMISNNGLKTMYVKGNKNDAYVVYRPGSENNATKLKDIAEKYDGYLHVNATEEDSRLIGQLLSYDEKDIEDYIERNRAIKGIQELKINNPNTPPTSPLKEKIIKFLKDYYTPLGFENFMRDVNIDLRLDGTIEMWYKSGEEIDELWAWEQQFNIVEKDEYDSDYGHFYSYKIYPS